MGIGTSLFLIATGAVMDFAIHPTSTTNMHGFDINAIGVILMVVGVIGLVISLVFWNSWGGFGGRRTNVEGGPVVRRTYRDEVV